MKHPIPDGALNSHIGILGKTGSGKTYTAKGLVERLLSMKRHVVIIDPTGAWYGLRTGYDIPIFGGRHGDVEIGDKAGEAVATVIVEQRTSAIVDLSLMTGGGQQRFMRGFANRLRQKPPGAIYVVIDEADEFLPQNIAPGQTNAFGDLKWMVRRGRLNGFRVMMITQRPAEIAKAVLTQIETLVAHRLTAPQDRKAIEEWIKGHHDPAEAREVLSSLASLEKGTAWVWAPDLDILSRSAMPPIATFDSSRTPEPGEVRIAPPALGDLDLSAIKDAMAVAEAPAQPDPEKGRIAQPAWPDQRKEVERLAAELDKTTAALERLTVHANELQRRHQAALKALGGEAIDLPAPPQRQPRPAPRQVAPAHAEPAERGNGAISMTKSQHRILDALAWWRAFGIETPTNEQAAFIAGYSPGSGNFNNLKGQLRSLELIDYPAPGRMQLLRPGIAAAVMPTIAVNQETFHAQVRAKLTGSQVRLLDPILAAYPDTISSDDVAAAAGYSAGSGNFNNLRGQLRTIGLIDYPQPGYTRAADWLFP